MAKNREVRRFCAEWEKQDGILLAFPHKNSDWEQYLKEAQICFCAVVREICRREKCVLLCDDVLKVREIFMQECADFAEFSANLFFLQIKTNDTWARDFGGLCVEITNRIESKQKKHTKYEILDFGFNGWGLKFASCFDNQITRKLHELGIFRAELKTKNMILEGGSIESNGAGIILTNTQCLLENNRNPQFSRKKIEKKLKKYFGAKEILWLNHGFLRGDDTDSHIDTLARFIGEKKIAYVKCDDPQDEHFIELGKMEKELEKIAKKHGFELVALPMCEAKFWGGDSIESSTNYIESDLDSIKSQKERLPATYANFLFVNGAILLPIYNDPKDKKAIEILRQACSEYEIVPIDCSTLIRQHGSLHCISMQFPKGVLDLEK